MRRIVAFGGAWLEEDGWSTKAMRTGSASGLSMSTARYVGDISEAFAVRSL